MDRSRGMHKRSALEDYLSDGDPEDSDPQDIEVDAELDDQDLEIARLLGQDV